MSDDQTTPENVDEAQPQEGAEPKPDLDELPDWAREKLTKANREAAKYRTEAKVNADAAKRLAEIEESKKSEEQKAAERIAAAEQRALELEAKANRADVSVETGIPADILAGPGDSSVEALTEFAEKVIEYAGRSNAPRVPKIDPNQGRNSSVALNGDGLEQALRNKLGIA